ncbi:hypothetical protein [Pseudomonas syringae group genomosp. 7]|uniref:hypothetical protein n=1 Tax=Pseudomonas syringae group genomosp. 7 TaxID=251699 RepID=UPI00376FDD69
MGCGGGFGVFCFVCGDVGVVCGVGGGVVWVWVGFGVVVFLGGGVVGLFMLGCLFDIDACWGLFV